MSDPALPTTHAEGRDGNAYGRQLAQLLPSGPAWRFAPEGPFALLLDALGQEFARVDGRAGVLPDEADPRTTLELLPDWERVAGLPDACTGQPDDTAERQVALHQKLTGIGGQSIADFVEIGARLGYELAIDEHREAQVGMRCEEPVNDRPWAFAWTVRVRPFDGFLQESDFLAYAKAGDRAGVRLRGFGTLDVECVIRRAAPAHTTVIFAYEIEPEPVFWMHFTQ